MNDWWTCPAESADDQLIMVTGRRDVQSFRSNSRFKIRIEITWQYAESGMPDEHDAELMEKATDALNHVLDRDPVAVMTGIYTGAGARQWIFYTLSTHIFQKKLNEALADLPTLPLEITAENDPEWAEYDEMRDLTEINTAD